MKTTDWQFDNSYLKLPKIFYNAQLPTTVKDPKLVLYNADLAKSLGLDFLETHPLQTAQQLSGNLIPVSANPIAQAYAGHQYGHFTMLGDGRAILLGEQITPKGERFDIQLKGAGATPYSRRGDGKATLKAMLREYLISEAMYHLHIPTSRSLAVVATGDEVYREEIQQGAVLTRVMQSHIRVGTFEYAAQFGTLEDLKTLTNYVIQRHYPEIQDAENPAFALLKSVANRQINLIIDWMRVGFIHGVMNTDNASISGETFDYGPCAFMNQYNPKTVFSSIDRYGRYAYQNQPSIIFWNLSVLGDTLLPLIHKDEFKAVEIVKGLLYALQVEYFEKWYQMMFSKLGISNGAQSDKPLVDELLQWMQNQKADYTNTFSALLNSDQFLDHPILGESALTWFEQWDARILNQKGGIITAQNMMKETNPFVIPRNHIVEEVLDQAVMGDFSAFKKFLIILQQPYEIQNVDAKYLSESDGFDASYKTYCGT